MSGQFWYEGGFSGSFSGSVSGSSSGSHSGSFYGDGSGLTGVGGSGENWDGFIVKNVQDSNSTTSYITDSELSVEIPSGEYYTEIYILIDNNNDSNPGFWSILKFNTSLNARISMRRAGVPDNSISTWGYSQTLSQVSLLNASIGEPVSAGKGFVLVNIYSDNIIPMNFDIQFKVLTTSGGGSVYVRKGSFIRYKQIN